LTQGYLSKLTTKIAIIEISLFSILLGFGKKNLGVWSSNPTANQVTKPNPYNKMLQPWEKLLYHC
jgi:hypothetical protein